MESSTSSRGVAAESAPAREKSAPTSPSAHRRDLVELLDRIVAYEHYYRSVYGHYTKLLTRVGVSLPAPLTEVYEIRVVEATPDRLMIQALSEEEGKPGDIITLNQDYEIHANFSLPAPRSEYLRAQALKHLRALRDAPGGQAIAESGVFRGYFKFDVRHDAQENRTAFAIGTRDPVADIQLEVGTKVETAAPLDLVADDTVEPSVTGTRTGQTGQRPVANVMTTLEEAYLAQRIFRGEMGRYAKDWSELSRIAKFRFRDRERYPAAQVPFGDSGPGLEIDVQDLLGPARDIAGVAAAAPELQPEPEGHLEADKNTPLVIEPIGSGR